MHRQDCLHVCKWVCWFKAARKETDMQADLQIGSFIKKNETRDSFLDDADSIFPLCVLFAHILMNGLSQDKPKEKQKKTLFALANKCRYFCLFSTVSLKIKCLKFTPSKGNKISFRYSQSFCLTKNQNSNALDVQIKAT